MNKNIIKAGALTTLIAVGGMIGSVSAQTVADETGLTEDQIIAIALTEVPGEVSEVEREIEDGVDIYEVEIVSEDGTEFEVEINAITGEVLEIEEERDHDCGKGKRGHKDRDDAAA